MEGKKESTPAAVPAVLPERPIRPVAEVTKGKTLAEKLAANRASASASGSTGSTGSAGVSRILGLPLTAGTEGNGFTAQELRAKLGYAGSSRALRQRIRDAQQHAGQNGACVWTDAAHAVVVDGKEIGLPRATKRYFVIAATVAKELPPEVIDGIADSALDFRFGNRMKASSRASLIE